MDKPPVFLPSKPFGFETNLVAVAGPLLPLSPRFRFHGARHLGDLKRLAGPGPKGWLFLVVEAKLPILLGINLVETTKWMENGWLWYRFPKWCLKTSLEILQFGSFLASLDEELETFFLVPRGYGEQNR